MNRTGRHRGPGQDSGPLERFSGVSSAARSRLRSLHVGAIYGEARRSARDAEAPVPRPRGCRVPHCVDLKAAAAGGTAVLVWLTIVSAAAAPSQEIIDRVLAVAAGNVIMLSDVSAARDFGLVTPAPAGDPIRDVLSRLIDRALVMAEVERYAPPEPDAAAVDRALDVVRARFATKEQFDRALERVGMSEAHLREIVRGDLRIQAYLEQRFTVAAPNDEELDRYYHDRPELFARGGRLPPLAEIRDEVIRAAIGNRRRALVTDWIADLRRRADVVDLYSVQRLR